MPFCAAVADSLREAFGADAINAQLKAGKFYARENGIELGQRETREGVQPAIVRAVALGKVARGR